MEEIKKQGMESLFCPYEQALALKELGFDEPCFGCYDEKCVFGFTVMSIKQYYTNSKEDTWNCAAPTFSQAFRWFREKYNLHFPIAVSDGFWFFERWRIGVYKTYEEAELACLNKLIEIVKNK